MLAIETLSWMEMQRLSEKLALIKTVKQLRIRDADIIRLAYRLICETTRRRNFIDRFINDVLKPNAISEFNLGIQAFLRLYVYQTRMTRDWAKIDIEEAENIAKLARSILGWKNLKEIEPVLGVLLTQKPTAILKDVSDEERIGLLTSHPMWFVRYCFKLLGRKEAIIMFKENMRTPPTYLRLNTLKAPENQVLRKLEEDRIKRGRLDNTASRADCKITTSAHKTQVPHSSNYQTTTNQLPLRQERRNHAPQEQLLHQQ